MPEETVDWEKKCHEMLVSCYRLVSENLTLISDMEKMRARMQQICDHIEYQKLGLGKYDLLGEAEGLLQDDLITVAQARARSKPKGA